MVETGSPPDQKQGELTGKSKVTNYQLVLSSLLKFLLSFFILAYNFGETFDRDREQDKPFTKSFQRLLKKLKRRRVRTPTFSKYLHKFRCRNCPDHACIVIVQGGLPKIRSVCFQFPGLDNYVLWEDVTGLQEDNP
jgi:hypothetical protein